MFIKRRIYHFRLIPCGLTIWDKTKLTILALFYLLPNTITNKQAHTPETIINLTKNTSLKTNNTHYRLSHPRQLYMITNGYEKPIQKWFQQSGETFLDVGANIGKYTMQLASRFKHVYSFEPIEETYNILNYNITMNKLINVSTFKLAAWDKVEALTFYLKNNPGGNSAEMMERNIGIAKVSAIPLDLMFNQFGRVDFVKIDVEGAELQALTGMQNILTTFKPRLVVEILERNEVKVYNYLESLGYHLQAKQNRNHYWAPS